MTSDSEAESSERPPRVRVVLVTGLSGAGRTSALKVLEDIGYEAVDNLPLSLIGRLVAPLAEEGGRHALAIAVDFRTRGFSAETFDQTIAELTAGGDIDLKVLFMDCDHDVLARRFTETRRRHPLADDRPVTDGIFREREMFQPIADRADLIIDTTQLTGSELKRLIEGHFRLAGKSGPTVSILSFSYRRGLPREADLVFDVRFLANPHYVPELKPLTGRDQAVADYIANDPAFEGFVNDIGSLLLRLLPLYRREGKSYLTIAIGCTGGQHRSVATAERLARDLHRAGHDVLVRHRDAPLGEDDDAMRPEGSPR
jgi:UPF0042 nucleotide-binding protein